MDFVANNDYEIMTDEGWKDFSGISLNGEKRTGRITFTDGRQVVATHNHEFFIDDNKVKLENICLGDRIDGGDNVVAAMYPHHGKIDVYDVVGVKNNDHSFLINGGVKTKNCDEFAFVRKHVADEFWSANYPTISASEEAKIIIISTPCGIFNQFHTIYTMAERKENEFKSLKFDWRVVPGRDEKWAENQRKNLGLRRFRQEYAVEFLGSIATVIDATVLEDLYTMTEDPVDQQLGGDFIIYEKPIDGAQYILGVDSAKGTGENYSVIQVLKLESMKPIKLSQVAKYRSNVVDVFRFADTVNKVAYFYNQAYIMVENNAEGSAVVNRLWWEHENEGLVNTGSKAQDLGIRATTKTKPRAVLLMKKLIEDGSLSIVDYDTVAELSSFIEQNNKFFGRDTNDDTVSALYWAVFILEMNLFEESYELHKGTKQEEDEGWGILSDVEPGEDFSWLTKDF